MCGSCWACVAKCLRWRRRTIEANALLSNLEVEPIVQFAQIMKSSSAFDEKYEIVPGSVLGSGMSGPVRVAQVRRSGAEVALKILPTANLSPIRLEQTLSEVQNQLSMKHQNICALLEVYEEPQQLKLVMERLHGINVLEHFNRKGGYSEGETGRIVRQMLMAVAYCHRKGVCHKDLKPENFCFEDDSNNARLKLIDFGLSEAFSSSMPMTHACGSLYYVAPEVLRQKYTEKCDVWSIGVITYILLEGRRPFEGDDDMATVMQIRSGRYPPLNQFYTQKAHDFVRTLICVEPTLRPSAEAALVHPWMERVAERVAERCSTDTQVKFDPALLRGMRVFSRSNALKQTLLGVLAPIATAQEVARWADQFEAIDTQGTGSIPVTELARKLRDVANCSDKEAEALSTALAAYAGVEGDERVSYPAFLTACLCSHMTLDDSTLRDLFKRFDADSEGRISLKEVRAALGDVVATSDLEEEKIAGNEISYDTFKRLLLGPRPGQNKGLKQLLGACRDGPKGWGVATVRAKHGLRADDDAAIEAARAENALWRNWAREKGGEVVPDTTPREAEVPPKKPSNEGLRVQEFKEKLRNNEAAFIGDWKVATTEAKTGDLEAARRENLAWRMQAQQELKDQARKEVS